MKKFVKIAAVFASVFMVLAFAGCSGGSDVDFATVVVSSNSVVEGDSITVGVSYSTSNTVFTSGDCIQVYTEKWDSSKKKYSRKADGDLIKTLGLKNGYTTYTFDNSDDKFTSKVDGASSNVIHFVYLGSHGSSEAKVTFNY